MLKQTEKRACSAAGSAPHSHCGGRRFESDQVHQKRTFVCIDKGSFQRNPHCSVGEIIFDDEIPCGDEIRLDARWVDLISSTASGFHLRSRFHPCVSKDFIICGDNWFAFNYFYTDSAPFDLSRLFLKKLCK